MSALNVKVGNMHNGGQELLAAEVAIPFLDDIQRIRIGANEVLKNPERGVLIIEMWGQQRFLSAREGREILLLGRVNNIVLKVVGGMKLSPGIFRSVSDTR